MSTEQKTFLVRLEHPDEQGWNQWARPHVGWVLAQVEAGAVIASGGSVDTAVKQGWLVMRAENEAALREILATDPFWEQGLVENLLIVEWDPIFGRLAEFSTRPDGLEGLA